MIMMWCDCFDLLICRPPKQASQVSKLLMILPSRPSTEGEKSYSEKAREENSWPFKSPLRLLLWQLCGFLTMSFPSGLMRWPPTKLGRIELPSMPDIWTVSWRTFHKALPKNQTKSSSIHSIKSNFWIIFFDHSKNHCFSARFLKVLLKEFELHC